MSRFVLTLKLKTETFQIDELDKRFNLARLIFNACLRELEKRERKLKNSKQYNKNKRSIKAINVKLKRKTLPKKQKTQLEKEKKQLYKEINILQKEFGLNDSSIQKFINPMRSRFEGKLDSDALQKIASRTFETWNKRFMGKSKRVHYKKYGEMDSVECKKNSAGIRFKDGYVHWFDLKIPVMLDENNMYETEGLLNRICYCRLKRSVVRGKIKYYLQLILESVPPKKRDKNTGFFKHGLGVGDVGIDIGISTTAIVGTKKVLLTELAKQVELIEAELTREQRKINRSRVSTNPSKFNENGTIKTKNKDPWFQSKNYQKVSLKVRELHRKSTALKKLSHILLSNNCLSYGNHFKVEHMNFKGLQRRTKETTINKKTGQFNRKKRFGKSILNKAPKLFLTILKNKAPKLFLTILKNKVENYGGTFNEVNTWKVKASQFNHQDESYTKKKLSKRWNEFEDGTKVQRDLYSAFIIQHVNDDLESVDVEGCKKDFESFKELHDNEIDRLTLNKEKTPISLGI